MRNFVLSADRSGDRDATLNNEIKAAKRMILSMQTPNFSCLASRLTRFTPYFLPISASACLR